MGDEEKGDVDVETPRFWPMIPVKGLFWKNVEMSGARAGYDYREVARKYLGRSRRLDS